MSGRFNIVDNWRSVGNQNQLSAPWGSSRNSLADIFKESQQSMINQLSAVQMMFGQIDWNHNGVLETYELNQSKLPIAQDLAIYNRELSLLDSEGQGGTEWLGVTRKDLFTLSGILRQGKETFVSIVFGAQDRFAAENPNLFSGDRSRQNEEFNQVIDSFQNQYLYPEHTRPIL